MTDSDTSGGGENIIYLKGKQMSEWPRSYGNLTKEQSWERIAKVKPFCPQSAIDLGRICKPFPFSEYLKGTKSYLYGRPPVLTWADWKGRWTWSHCFPSCKSRELNRCVLCVFWKQVNGLEGLSAAYLRRWTMANWNRGGMQIPSQLVSISDPGWTSDAARQVGDKSNQVVTIAPSE